MKTLKTWVAAATMAALSGAAQAALVSLGDGTVKDTNTNLIWLMNWNVNGKQNWSTQKAWAEGLDFAGSTDWVLPEISDYAALRTAYGDLTAVTNFTNVQSDRYWSGTVFSPGFSSWRFSLDNGGLLTNAQHIQYFAVAVRPGDVTASVPEPQTLALVLLALSAMAVARRRRPIRLRETCAPSRPLCHPPELRGPRAVVHGGVFAISTGKAATAGRNLVIANRRITPMQAIRTLSLAAALLAGAHSAGAALVDRGGGMIYDTTRNITWLADMNYAQTSGYDSDGRMTWQAAKEWANNLAYGGYDDWRLPTTNPSDTSCTGGFGVGKGFNCTGGEMGGLFVSDLGYNNNGSGLITSDDTAEQIANLALFSNLQSGMYWYGTEGAPSLTAWTFRTNAGLQLDDPTDIPSYAVAVRDGDVATAVPEPHTLALALAALSAAYFARRRD